MAQIMLTMDDIAGILNRPLPDVEQIVGQPDFPKIIIDGIPCVAQDDFENWVGNVWEKSVDISGYLHKWDEKLLQAGLRGIIN